MKIGIAYDLKSDHPASANLPDDYQEEFDSPVTIDAIAAVLEGLGHEVERLGDGRELLERLLHKPPDFVFNIAEGHGIGRCREARVPAVLEMLGIPYTGSDPLTLAATLDKDCAKRLVQSAGVTVPAGSVIQPEEDLRAFPDPFPAFEKWPKIIKPTWEGSSKGIRDKSLVNGPGAFLEAVENLRRDHVQPILVEEFIAGDELTVAILGNRHPRIVGIMRVLPTQPTNQFVYSLEVKRDYLRQVRYECPARLPDKILQAVSHDALTAYRALGCRDVSRIDFRLRNGIPYFLEVNPLPGLNPESSDLVILSRLAGWSYEQLIVGILNAAVERTTEKRSLRP